jgi:hypothetical protein
MKFDATVLNYLESYDLVLEAALTQPAFNAGTRYKVKDAQLLTKLQEGIKRLKTSNPVFAQHLVELEKNIDFKTGIIDFNTTGRNRAAALPGEDATTIATAIYDYLVAPPATGLDVRNMMTIEAYPYTGVNTPITRTPPTAPAKKTGGNKLDWIKKAHKEILDTIGKGQPTITGR